MDINHLKRAIIHNEYSNLDVKHALAPRQRSQTQKEKPPGIATLPCQQAASNKIRRLLKASMKKNVHKVRHLKAKSCLKFTIYCVSCGWGKMYVEQTGRTIKTWCKEHMRHIHLGKPEKSAVVRSCAQ
jgi:hypothetical protein